MCTTIPGPAAEQLRSMFGSIACRLLLVDAASMTWRRGKAMAALPFDALRTQYASAVNAGIVPRSMLASRDFEQALAALERVTLGPFARRI